MRVFTIILSVISITSIILPMFRASLWWVRIFDYPQWQAAVLCVISTVLLFAVFGYKSNVTFVFTILLMLALIYKVPSILKYTPLGRINAEQTANAGGPGCLRIIQCNVRMENREAGQVIDMVHNHLPDILLIVEPDDWWAEQLKVLDMLFPHSVKNPLNNTYGMILFSAFPLTNTEVNYLVKPDIPSIFTTVQLPNNQSFNLHCLHPQPPRPGTNTYERDAELLIVGKRVRKNHQPAVVVGDLNDVAWSYTSELFQRYSQLLDPREGRGFFNTYNAKIPILRYPLDHFFYSKHFGLSKLQKLEAVGSDHFPMLMDICLEEQADHSQNQEPADQEDKKEVEEKIQEGK